MHFHFLIVVSRFPSNSFEGVGREFFFFIMFLLPLLLECNSIYTSFVYIIFYVGISFLQYILKGLPIHPMSYILYRVCHFYQSVLSSSELHISFLYPLL